MEDAIMKTKTRLAAGFITVLLAGLVTAQTKAVVTIGGSLWNAKWEGTGESYNGMKADAGTWVGPYLNIRMGKLLFGTSMYFGKIPLKISSEAGEDFAIDLKRSDLNFSLGYSLHKYLNAFFAVKNATIKGDKTIPFTLGEYDGFGNLIYYDTQWKMENKGTLFGGGLSGTYRFPQSPIFLFGSFALLKGTMNNNVSWMYENVDLGSNKKEMDVTLKSFNGGIGFQTGSGISLLVGYRGENSSGEGGGKEKVNGIMATLAYTLR